MWCRNAAMPLNPERWNPASLVTAAAAAAAHSRRLKERQTPSCATKCAASSNCEDDPLSKKQALRAAGADPIALPALTPTSSSGSSSGPA